MDPGIFVDVNELGNRVNIDDLLQSVQWTQVPTQKKIHLFVVRQDVNNEPYVTDLEIGSHMEDVKTTCPTKEKIQLVCIEDVEPVVNMDSDYANETGCPLPDKISPDSGQVNHPLIDLETIDVDNCSLEDKATQTIGTEAYQGSDVQVEFEGDWVEGPVKPKSVLMSKENITQFVRQKFTLIVKAEKHDSKVCKTSGRILNSDAASSELTKICPLCLKVVPSEMNLHKHLLWHLLAKNANERHFADSLAEEEFKLDWPIVEDKSFEELLGECKQHLKSEDGLYCNLCFKNFEFHYDVAQLVDLVDFSDLPKCVECHEVYKDLTSLELHVKQHLGSKPFGCCICHKVFEEVSEVKLHMDSHVFHTYGKFFQCRYCSKLSFTEKDIKLHESFHLNAANLWRFSTKSKCQEVTRDQGSNWYKNEKAVDNFFHPVSSAVFDFRRNLPRCESAVEVMEEVSKFTKLETTSCNEKALLEGELRALTSVINFSKELGELLSEVQNTSQCSDNISDISGQLMAYNQVLSSSYGSILSNLYKHKCWCNFCGQSFPCLEEMCSHKDVCHKAPRLFPCEDCSAEFNSMNLLFEHRNTHRELHLQKCPICDTNFNYKFDITQHLKVHFAGTLRRCPECGMQFKFRSQLVQHLQTHFEITHFLDKCKQCNAFFAGKDQLKKHMLRMHLVERPYECSVCGKRFFRQNVWLLHSKGHIRNKFRKSLRGMDLYKPCKWSKTKVLNS